MYSGCKSSLGMFGDYLAPIYALYNHCINDVFDEQRYFILVMSN